MKKIVLIDDDQGIVESLTAILEDEGYAVETSLKGHLAVNKVTQQQPDLVILDVLISGTDGRDICRQLKNQDSTHGIPVVMISAHPNIRDEAFDAGADEFLSKPFEVDELLDTIHAQIATQ